jgi:peroxiredoxin Q/BCP
MNLLDFSFGAPLKVGATAPNVSAQDQDGNEVELKSIYAQGDVLLFFFPMAETAGCTAQACSMRDRVQVPTGDRALQVVGISSDSIEKLQRFKKNERLPFPLLSDSNHRLSKAFGVPRYFGLLARQSFLVRDGKIAWRMLSAGTSNHAKQVNEALKEIG